MMSVSRFTVSPARFLPRVVTAAVWGMSGDGEALRPPTATVRLMPSMVMEPFSTMYRSSSGAA